MGRTKVHTARSRYIRLALKCAVAMLPALLCACQKYQLLVDDTPYQITPLGLKVDESQVVHADGSGIDPNADISPIDYAMAPPPPLLDERREIVKWDMTLQDVIFHALSNSKILRQGGQFLSPNNSLLRSPEGVPTVYDQAIQSTGVLFGQRGEQAALSEFDAQFTTRMLWGNNSLLQNSRNTGLAAGTALIEDTAQFQSSLQRALFSGGQVGLSHNWNYSSNNNVAGRLFPSVYEGNLKAEFRQPLLAGAGSEYTRIAGPISENIQGVTGVQQGILIARLNAKLTEADFELSVISYLRDVEMQYWKLFLAYERHQILAESLEDAKGMLKMLEARIDSPGSDLALIVEAREGVLTTEQKLLEALDGIYSNESQLRMLMGFSLQSEKMIHPTDQPIVAEIKHDWSSSLGSALARRPELRRQKDAIRSAELQLTAAENLNRPRLDLLASGQTNGFGDNLIGSRSTDRTNLRIGNAYDRLMRGNETGWNLGFEYSQPLGLRFASQQVKNQELKLAKARKILEAQEAEVLHELTAAFQGVNRTFLALQKQQSVVSNAEDRMLAAEANYNSNKDGRGYIDLDSLNRARDMHAEAAAREEEAKVEYSMALTEVEYRTGRLLDHHNVVLSSSPELAMTVQMAQLPPASATPTDAIPMTPPAIPPAPGKKVEPTPLNPPPNSEDITIITRPAITDEITILTRSPQATQIAVQPDDHATLLPQGENWKPSASQQRKFTQAVESDNITESARVEPDTQFAVPILVPATLPADETESVLIDPLP